jgi:hypothetical protein
LKDEIRKKNINLKILAKVKKIAIKRMSTKSDRKKNKRRMKSQKKFNYKNNLK